MRRGKINLFHKVSVKSKFLMIILGIAVLCISVVGFQGLQYGKKSLTKSMHDHLTSLKSARTQQIENYFKNNRNLMKTFASEHTIIDAMNKFSAAFKLLDIYQVGLDKNSSNRVSDFYKKSFVVKLNHNTIEEYSYTSLVPKKEVTQYLQYQYIVNNQTAMDKKRLLNKADDKSYYSEVHGKYHHSLKEMVKNQGFSDLFLIDAKTQNIIYSVNKKVDFGSSLQNGPYAQSALAKIVRDIINQPEKGVVVLSDFHHYIPSYNTPQAFFATPVYDNNVFIGILATQISSKVINNITTGYQAWEHDGLGKSGEVYLVGRDYKMRSDARKIIQDPEAYITEINGTNLDANQKKLITAMKTTVLHQEVKSESVKLATEGEEGTIITKNYLGKKVLSSYAPLNIEGLNWSIIAEKGIQEAEQPIREFENALLISATILATLITFYAIWLAYTFLSPINSMAQGVKNILNKKSTSKIELNRDDEFGELSHNIDTLIETLHKQEQEIKEKSKENDELLLNILPQSIAQRVKNGEKHIAETVNNVAVLFSTLQGFDHLSQSMEASKSIELLNELINQFDEETKKFGIEKITTIGDSYMAASGLIQPRLDYARRITEFATKMFEVVDNFNLRHNTNLILSVGIDSGEVMAGIVGEYKFVYDIWGEAVNDANRISHEAEPGTLRVSKAVYDQLTNQDEYTRCDISSEETYAIVLMTQKG